MLNILKLQQTRVTSIIDCYKMLLTILLRILTPRLLSSGNVRLLIGRCKISAKSEFVVFDNTMCDISATLNTKNLQFNKFVLN